MKKEEIYISQGKRPFWQIIIAALLYTGSFFCIYLLIAADGFGKIGDKARNIGGLLQIAILLFGNAIAFSVVKDYHFDFKNSRYKTLYGVGPIKLGKWKTFKNLDYVSVFLNGSEEYEINLWHDKNQHFNISKVASKDIAFEYAKAIAKELYLQVFDATVKNDFKWLEE